MQLDLKDEDLRKLVSEAILRSLDEKKREAMISEAIKVLLTADTSRYSSGRSPLQDAFNSAVRIFAEEEVRKSLQSDPAVSEKIKGLIADAWTKFLDGEKRDELVSEIAEKIARSFTRD